MDICGFVSLQEKDSVRRNSFFEGFTKSLKTIFKFVYFWTQNKMQDEIAQELNLNKNTATQWCHILRGICQKNFYGAETTLGGTEEDGSPKIVKIDESLFFRRKYNVGLLTSAQWIFGIIEKGTRKCVLIPFQDRSRETLEPIICQYIAPEARL